jgi:hypothetical protein
MTIANTSPEEFETLMRVNARAPYAGPSRDPWRSIARPTCPRAPGALG